MNQQRRKSSLLELEAADYFRLDPSQVNLFIQNRTSSRVTSRPLRPDPMASVDCGSKVLAEKSCVDDLHVRSRMSYPAEDRALVTKPSSSDRSRSLPSTAKQKDQKRRQQIVDSNGYPPSSGVRCGGGQILVRKQSPHVELSQARVTSKPIGSGPTTATRASGPSHREKCHHFPPVDSSASSTNSLPSISSSPSVSPYLMCPHLSIDDILRLQSIDNRNKSPHTIGLCARCHLDPPPNIHSPLSPAFKPSSHMHRSNTSQSIPYNRKMSPLAKAGNPAPRPAIRRGYSDYQAIGAKKMNQVRNESLDFAMEPDEIKRLQLSPTLRNSVEYIRNNSIESGRVVRIYKNGEPFDKPLRICITRKEFNSLNNLLDYINSRLLVASGARHLFHLDGQLVYSVHELKHGSSYIVSGTRALDLKSTDVLKSRIGREVELSAQRSHNSRSMSSNLTASGSDKLGRDQLQESSSGCPQSITTGGKQPHAVAKERAQKGEPLRPSATFSASTTNLTNGGNQTDMSIAFEAESPTKVTRAKSELSALPPKRKKVTFMDTGRGSSPTIPNPESSDAPFATVQVANTMKPVRGRPKAAAPRSTKTVPKVVEASDPIGKNEIGIQVSDSLDGFLIDLPIAIPGGRGDETTSTPRSRVGPRSRPVKNPTNDHTRISARPRPKVVTITERQLSLDEINQFKDLDHGDHHSEAQKKQLVTILLEKADSDSQEEDVHDEKGENKKEEESVVPDRTGTINIGSDPDLDSAVTTLITASDEPATKDPDALVWQYPGGRESMTTPIERPVSQSDANELVRAKVTTPSPSLSTMGDSGSLSMSYDAITALADRGETATSHRDLGVPIRAQDLPPKNSVPVVGLLRNGLDVPKQNFSLVWVNGFTINDQYPDNSSAAALSTADTNQEGDSGLLSPQKSHTSQVSMLELFKLSDRFSNWICHSRKHDELVYPAGTLIVLWSRWTDSQRFYSRHTTSVCALTLVSVEPDLAASAQIGEIGGDPSQVHIWSLTRLETLRIVSDDHLRGRLLFSLRAKHSAGLGCQLAVAAKDDKRLWISQLSFKLPLTATGDGEASDKSTKISGTALNTIDSAVTGARSITKSSSGSHSASGSNGNNQANSPITVIRESKLLAANQHPLFIMPIAVEQQPPVALVTSGKPSKGATKTALQLVNRQQQLASSSDLLLSFGRRHFQLWAPDMRQRKLRLLQPDAKSSSFGELMVKATSLARMSPMEFLLGDVDGNVALLELDCSSGKPLVKSNQTSDSLAKYNVRVQLLLGPLASASAGEDVPPLLADREPPKPPAITCLSRISGSIFAAADSSCRVTFWKFERHPKNPEQPQRAIGDQTVRLESVRESYCRQVGCISLPQDLGFICTILAANYIRKQGRAECYVISTSNAILFGSVQLQLDPDASASVDILANSSVSVVYEGHETSVMNLVADHKLLANSAEQRRSLNHDYYFTCSLDCKICKWDGKRLVWKSMLPSACASLAVHPTGSVLAIGSTDGAVYILDKVSGLLISYFPLTPVRINCLAYTRDGGLMAAGCANGSIFVLPVYEHGLRYSKVSIFQSPFSVMSIQFSLDSRHILTSVSHDSYQDLILWDLPKFRYMRDNVRLAADRVEWFDSICSGSEDVRATWESVHLRPPAAVPRRNASGGVAALGSAVNVCCHRSVQADGREEDCAIAGDTRGHLRLFRYPAYDVEQGFYEVRASSSAVNCCRFLGESRAGRMFVSSSMDGPICLWRLERPAH